MRPARMTDHAVLAELDALAWSADAGFPSIAGFKDGTFFTTDNPPEAHLVAELLEHHRPIVRHYARRRPLLRDVRPQRLRARRIQAVARLEPSIHRIIIDADVRELAPAIAEHVRPERSHRCH